MSSKPRLAIFDLDGTLIDSAPDLADALDFALRTEGLPACGEPQARDYIGNGANRLVHRAITGEFDGIADESVFSKVFHTFLERYDEHLFHRSQVYCAVDQTLGQLRQSGWTLAVATNKPARFSRPLLKLAGIERHFSAVVSGDTLERKKPDAMPIIHLIEQFSTTAQNAAMIGDSATDVESAANAGVRCLAVGYGYHGGYDLQQDPRCEVVDEFAALRSILENLIPAADCA